MGNWTDYYKDPVEELSTWHQIELIEDCTQHLNNAIRDVSYHSNAYGEKDALSSIIIQGQRKFIEDMVNRIQTIKSYIGFDYESMTEEELETYINYKDQGLI